MIVVLPKRTKFSARDGKFSLFSSFLFKGVDERHREVLARIYDNLFGDHITFYLKPHFVHPTLVFLPTLYVARLSEEEAKMEKKKSNSNGIYFPP